MVNDTPDADVEHLPEPKPRPPQRHVLDAAKVILADPASSSHEQHEKTCRNCGVVRVTMIGGIFPRVWRLLDGSLLLAEPACEALDAAQVVP